MASLDQAVEMFLLLNGCTLVFLEFGLEMAAPHFDAYLSPEPHGSHGSPELSLVQGGHKGIHNLHEVLEGLGLDSPDDFERIVSIDILAYRNGLCVCLSAHTTKRQS